jgi:transcription initiation factor IIF auxiliary subunit
MPVEYNSFFTDNVQGAVRVEFELKNGAPVYEEEDGLKHYSIIFSLVAPPGKVKKVVYHLDPSYHDPVRETKDASSNFRIESTSYGDYFFNVTCKLPDGEAVRQRVHLSEALAETHQNPNPAITQALADIRAH